MISIVTPVYNEEDNVVFFHDEITKVIKKTGMDDELIYVKDGSKDRTDELDIQMYVSNQGSGDSPAFAAAVRAYTWKRLFV